MNLYNTAAVGHCHFELVTVNVNGLTARGEVAKGLHHQPANGIDLFIAEVGPEGVVEVLNGGQRPHGPGVAAELTEVDIFFFVLLIFDFSHDQLKNILDRDQSGNAAKFINNNRHVVTLRAKLFQHPVHTFTFRHNHGLA